VYEDEVQERGGEAMQVQSLAFVVSDPFALPCVVARCEEAVRRVDPGKARVVGIGHYEEGEPLIGRYRPPTSGGLQGLLSRLTCRLALAAAMHSNGPCAEGGDLQPFRFRNWLFVMAGGGEQFARGQEPELPIPTYIRKNIRGGTVGEWLFHQFLAFLHPQGLLAGERMTLDPLRNALKSALSQEAFKVPGGERDATLLLTDGEILLAATLGRPLYYLPIHGLEKCTACGGDGEGNAVAHPHVRAVVLLDTAALPSGEWETIGPGNLFQVDARGGVETYGL
jgi:hypothetical protein